MRLILIVVFLSYTTLANAVTRRVPSEHTTIQAAIDASSGGDTVLVAPGTYTGEGNWDIRFLGKGITLKSEEGPESCIILCGNGSRGSYSGFLFDHSEDINSVVSGFTVTGAKGRSGISNIDGGGGFYCFESAPVIENCIMTCNTGGEGGAILAIYSRAQFINCTIQENIASEGGGAYIIGGQVRLVNCAIVGNYGGGLSCWDGNISLLNCSVVGNRSHGYSGGAEFVCTTAILTNCVFWGNTGYSTPGDSSNENASGIEISVLKSGRGAYPKLYIDQSLIGDDVNDLYVLDTLEWTVCGNRLMGDPLFVKPGYWDPNSELDILNDDFWVDGDYHLKSQGGRWDVSTEMWVQDDVTSPCIDAGDPNSPIDLELFPNGGIVNLGFYGGTSEASKSYFGTEPCETIMAGDINGDCTVDDKDLAILMSHWLWPQSKPDEFPPCEPSDPPASDPNVPQR